jgi:thiamine kinase-like enzyme
MFLTADNIIHYLFARDLLDPEEMVTSASVINASRRNRNFRVELEGRTGLFVKQVPAVFTETTGSIRREAYCYNHGRSDPSFAPLRPYIPFFLDYDPRQHTLTVELLPTTENLNAFHARIKDFPENVAQAVGRSLGTIHNGQICPTEVSKEIFPRSAPWVLNIAQTAESVFTNMSASTRTLVDILRGNPVLVQGLYGLAVIWRQETLIHGDIKWDNFLVANDGKLSWPDLRVVDWELADIGDSAWDVGCAFACYVQNWLATLGADGNSEDISDLIIRAPHRISAIWPAIRSLWEAYAQARRFSPAQKDREMRLAATFAAGRLVLTAFEMSIRMPDITRTSLLALQLATAMMTAPETALVEILGLTQKAGQN